MELNWKSTAVALLAAAAPMAAMADHTCKELTIPVTGNDGKVVQKGTGNYNCSAWFADDINLVTQRRDVVVTRKGKITKGGVEQTAWEDEVETKDTLRTAQAGGRGLVPSVLGSLWTISGIKLNVNLGNAASRESKAYERGVDNGAFKSESTTNYNCDYSYATVNTAYAGTTGCASATGGASTGSVVGGGTGGNSGYTTAITGGTASGAFSSQQNASGGSGVNTGTDGTVNTGTSLPTTPVSRFSFGGVKLGTAGVK